MIRGQSEEDEGIVEGEEMRGRDIERDRYQVCDRIGSTHAADLEELEAVLSSSSSLPFAIPPLLFIPTLSPCKTADV